MWALCAAVVGSVVLIRCWRARIERLESERSYVSVYGSIAESLQAMSPTTTTTIYIQPANQLATEQN